MTKSDEASTPSFRTPREEKTPPPIPRTPKKPKHYHSASKEKLEKPDSEASDNSQIPTNDQGLSLVTPTPHTNLRNAVSELSSLPSAATLQPTLNHRYQNESFIADFVDAFRRCNPFKDTESGACIWPNPFPCAELPNLFDDEFVNAVKSEALRENFSHRSNDLYEFYQSNDLISSEKPHLAALRNYIYSSKFISLMSRLTDIELSPYPIDLSAHQYRYKNYLLCHDDDINEGEKGRRIAFILYLVPEDWSLEDGGTLDLFDTDERNNPRKIVHSIVPRWNSLAFFELSRASYHQVSQVLRPDRTRVSISGWFYGSSERRLTNVRFRELDPCELNLRDFINTDYLSDENMASVRSVFVEKSCVELQKFLKEDIYQRLIESLGMINWSVVGPANVRRYYTPVPPSQDPWTTPSSRLQLIRQIQAVFSSERFAKYIYKITHVNVAKVHVEYRQFQEGCYTLLHDNAQEPLGMDVTLFLLPTDAEWNVDEWDGQTHYVATETLLTVSPRPNTLSIVLRDEGTSRFVKLVNRDAKIPRTEISCLYLEKL
ncbi:uncharacterized protein VTP21DRAFT_4692 [Calcarisporiella thermophila]|uniref:uncharacterized protein n=1 Tax=Calcarisporiella thermophila TaxID=911321 RepID=UPI003742A06B